MESTNYRTKPWINSILYYSILCKIPVKSMLLLIFLKYEVFELSSINLGLQLDCFRPGLSVLCSSDNSNHEKEQKTDELCEYNGDIEDTWDTLYEVENELRCATPIIARFSNMIDSLLIDDIGSLLKFIKSDNRRMLRVNTKNIDDMLLLFEELNNTSSKIDIYRNLEYYNDRINIVKIINILRSIQIANNETNRHIYLVNTAKLNLIMHRIIETLHITLNQEKITSKKIILRLKNCEPFFKSLKSLRDTLFDIIRYQNVENADMEKTIKTSKSIINTRIVDETVRDNDGETDVFESKITSEGIKINSDRNLETNTKQKNKFVEVKVGYEDEITTKSIDNTKYYEVENIQQNQDTHHAKPTSNAEVKEYELEILPDSNNLRNIDFDNEKSQVYFSGDNHLTHSIEYYNNNLDNNGEELLIITNDDKCMSEDKILSILDDCNLKQFFDCDKKTALEIVDVFLEDVSKNQQKNTVNCDCNNLETGLDENLQILKEQDINDSRIAYDLEKSEDIDQDTKKHSFDDIYSENNGHTTEGKDTIKDASQNLHLNKETDGVIQFNVEINENKENVTEYSSNQHIDISNTTDESLSVNNNDYEIIDDNFTSKNSLSNEVESHGTNNQEENPLCTKSIENPKIIITNEKGEIIPPKFLTVDNNVQQELLDDLKSTGSDDAKLKGFQCLYLDKGTNTADIHISSSYSTDEKEEDNSERSSSKDNNTIVEDKTSKKIKGKEKGKKNKEKKKKRFWKNLLNKK